MVCLGYWPSSSRLQAFMLQTCRSYKHEINGSSKKAKFYHKFLPTTKIRGRNSEILNTNIRNSLTFLLSRALCALFHARRHSSTSQS
jgi:hypothetical protein